MLVGPSTTKNTSIMSFSKHAKPNLNRAIADICYTNIIGLRTNFTSVKAFAMNTSPHLISLSETGLDPSISNREFDIIHLLDEAMSNMKIYSVETRNIRRGPFVHPLVLP